MHEQVLCFHNVFVQMPKWSLDPASEKGINSRMRKDKELILTIKEKNKKKLSHMIRREKYEFLRIKSKNL